MSPLKTSKVAVVAVSLSLSACQGALSPTELAVDEAAAALTVAEEGSELSEEAAVAEGPAEGALDADERAALPSAEAAPGVCDFEGRRAQVLARYDANGNQRLDPAERQTLRSELAPGDRLLARFALPFRARALPRLHWVFDADSDRQLSDDERTALVDALEARCERVRARVLATFDENGDGALNDAEKDAARAAARARLAAARSQLLARYDANANGQLDPAERAQLKADLEARWQAKQGQLLARYDVNGDGRLSAQEAAPLKAAVAQRIAEGREPTE